MRDLQHRLAALGFDAPADARGVYGDSTGTAVRGFQEMRGLPPDGICDRVTWDAVVEAGWRLGSRLLYLTSPMKRGDDVAELQRQLGALGFDAGRVDGIFGPDTERALSDFQRNAGLVTDAICGPATFAALARLGDRYRSLASVTDVREHERFRCGPRSLSGRTIALGHTGGLDALASRTARALTGRGAAALVLEHPDGSAQAAQANAAAADVFVGLAFADEQPGCRTAFYRSPAGTESRAGRLLAEMLGETIAGVLACDCRPAVPMTIPILRETRMPAVLVELSPPAVAVLRTAELAAALPTVLDSWIGRFGESS